MSRIKEFDKEYQFLTPSNTGLAKNYCDERDYNAVSVKDNQIIINFTPSNFKLN